MNLKIGKISSQILILILPFLILPWIAVSPIYADGVQLSSTQVGSTAMYTAQIPRNPCVKFNLGEGKNKTVVGFDYSAFGVDAAGVMSGNVIILDLSQSKVAQVTIAGKTISDFTLDPSYSQISNANESKRQQVRYKLNTPMEFTTSDTASIVVENVKVVSEGKVMLVFGLGEPTGSYCLHSGWTALSIGSNQIVTSPTPSLQKNLSSTNLTIGPTVIQATKTNETPVPSISKVNVEEEVMKKKTSSVIQKFIDFLKLLFHL